MRIFLNIVILLACCRGWASDTLVLGADMFEEYTLGGSYLEILEDSSKKLRIEDVLENENKFVLNQNAYAYNYNYRSAYWVKFSLKNLSGKEIHYVLESYSPNTESIQLYYKDETGTLQRRETGALIKEFKQEYKHKNLVLDLAVPAQGKSRTFYVRVFSEHHSGFDYKIKSAFHFSWYSNNEYYLLGIYYGTLLIMALYNLIIFFTLKVRLHLYYVFYILSGILSTLTEDKLGYHYLWPNQLFLNDLLTYYVAPVALLLTFMLYSVKFLELRTTYPVFFRVSMALTILYLILFLFSILITPLNFDLLRFFYVLPFLSVFCVSVYALFRGYKAARLFVAGVSILLLSVVLIQLRADHYIVPTAFTVYFLNYSLIAESLILSFALSDRIKIMSKEREVARQKVLEELEANKKLQAMVNQQLQEKQVLQEKINKELEEKVNERTQTLKEKMSELEIANARLEDLIEQANKMNIRLDLDNWELKKNVQQGLIHRITGAEVSFEIFKEVFKDEQTCLRFLDELKWHGGFVCKKCGNNRHKEIDKNFTRKCTKCSYPESVTAHTLLHGLKFPVQQCLYLIYLIHKRKGKIRLEEISEIGGISIPSSSKFKAKIQEQIEKIEKRKGGITNWEEIIPEG